MSGSEGNDEFTVYIVDDDRSVVDSLRALVKSAGMQPVCFISPTKFLSNYDHERRGCLLLDLHMTEVCGLDLQSKLVAIGARLPIIMMTGDDDAAKRAHAMSFGSFDFLIKPIEGVVLLNRIRHSINETYFD